MSNFELNVPDWFKPQAVQENEFLNDKLETDQYGRWYSVQFQGDAETYLWMAKSQPNAGEKYFGHLEETKSGKSVKFKKDKVPEGNQAPGSANKQSASNSQSTDESIARSVALKAAVDYVEGDVKVDFVLEVAEDFLGWLQGKNKENVKIEGEVVNNKEPLPEFPGEVDDEN